MQRNVLWTCDDLNHGLRTKWAGRLQMRSCLCVAGAGMRAPHPQRTDGQGRPAPWWKASDSISSTPWIRIIRPEQFPILAIANQNHRPAGQLHTWIRAVDRDLAWNHFWVRLRHAQIGSVQTKHMNTNANDGELCYVKSPHYIYIDSADTIN